MTTRTKLRLNFLVELNIEETPSEPKAIEVEKKDIRFTEKPFVSGSKSKGE